MTDGSNSAKYITFPYNNQERLLGKIDLPRKTLCEIITKYGQSICNEPSRCEGLLRDGCRNHNRREVSLLVSALKERVAVEILTHYWNDTTYEMLLKRLVKRLHDNLGITERFAYWAVESWAVALGKPSLLEQSIVEIQTEVNTTARFILRKASIERKTGRVKWWSDYKGYGVIEQDNGPDIFVYYTAISYEGFKTLKEGERVSFEITPGHKPGRLQAKDVIKK